MPIRVYEFEAKTRSLINSRILPKITNVDAFCKVTGINRANYYRICSNQRLSPTKENIKIVDVSEDILVCITRTYGVPASYFTKPYTISEFERLLNRGPWELLCELQQSSTQCDLLASGSDQYRFGFPDSSKEHQPALGSFKVKDPIVFELSGWHHWNVILLNRRPDGRITCLFPNPDQSVICIENDGQIRIPEKGFWEVQPQDPPGIHYFMAIFHEHEWLKKEIDTEWFCKQLSLESDTDQQRSVLSKLADWLEPQDITNPKSFEIVVKDLQVIH